MRKRFFAINAECCILRVSDVFNSVYDSNFKLSKDKAGRSGLLHYTEVTSLFPLPGRFITSKNSDK